MNRNEDKYSRAFNARYMSFEEIGRSFVLSDHFKEVIKNEHTILIGSRGCGKTTLLKMLHPKALNEWTSPESEIIKKQIGFTGIYIPADRQWKAQLDTFKSLYDNVNLENIYRGIVNANVLIATCSTLRALIDIQNMDKVFEIELALQLIDNWEIPTPIIPNLDAIIIKLRSIVSDFNVIVRKGLINELLPKLCYVDFIDLLSISIDIIENLNKQQKTALDIKRCWALCFDELEIAPEFLQKELRKQDMRSRGDQRILLKLTSTPNQLLDAEEDPSLKASHLDDYNEVKLWVYDKRSQKQWRSFCEKYLSLQLINKFNQEIDIDLLLGNHSYYHSLKLVEKSICKFDNREHAEFEKNGFMWSVMKSLQSYDNSFYDYLVRKGLDPFNPVPKNDNEASSIHRKIKPIVLYRYYYTCKSNRRDRLKGKRSRNINVFNHGKDYIFDIADGNPRGFANLVNDLLQYVNANNNQNQSISIMHQARLINSFSEDYAYLRIQNYPRNLIQNQSMLLHEMIDKIGEYFFDKLINEDFTADPAILFSVTKGEKKYQEFIEIALESGAILKIEEEINKKGVRKNTEVYRLAYSLYPYYKLPKVVYNSISLSTIFKPKRNLLEDSNDLFSNLLT